jgi:hypothetical protein
MNSFECPREGNRCSFCLEIGKATLRRTLMDTLPHSSAENRESIIDNAKLQGMIEEQADLSLLGCEARQHRAIKIAKELGEKYD